MQIDVEKERIYVVSGSKQVFKVKIDQGSYILKTGSSFVSDDTIIYFKLINKLSDIKSDKQEYY